MEKIKEITLFSEETERNSFLEWVSISEKGELRLDGNDCGDAPLTFWGDIDYEYWRIIDKDWKDTVLLLLIKEQFKRFTEFENWLDKKKIPMTGGSY